MILHEVGKFLNLVLANLVDYRRVDLEVDIATDFLLLLLHLWLRSWCRLNILVLYNRCRLNGLLIWMALLALAEIDAHTSQSIEIPVGIACLL